MSERFPDTIDMSNPPDSFHVNYQGRDREFIRIPVQDGFNYRAVNVPEVGSVFVKYDTNGKFLGRVVPGKPIPIATTDEMKVFIK